MSLLNERRFARRARFLARGVWCVVIAGCAGATARAPDAIAMQPAARAASPDTDTATAREVRFAETFDAAWRVVYERHFDTTFNGVNWVAVRAELLPRARAARTLGELRGIIREMLGRLGQSHFALIPGTEADSLGTGGSDTTVGGTPGRIPVTGVDSEAPPPRLPDAVQEDRHAERPGTLGMELRLVGDRFYVSRVDSAGAAYGAGVRPGWEVLDVDHLSLESLVESAGHEREKDRGHFQAALVAAGALDGAVGEVATIRAVDDRGRVHQLSLRRREQAGTPVRFGNLPPLHAQLQHRRIRGAHGTTVGVISFNIWMPLILRQFDEAIDDLRDTDGIVIDLRGNPGGVAAMVMGTSGHFLNERVTLGTMKTRDNELRFVSNPRRVDVSGRRIVPYAGPLAILIDGLTGSTSEMFAGGLQAIGRAKVFGETSAGQVLPALSARLPNGDVLYYAFADFLTAKGIRLEGRGVIPDVEVPLSRGDLLAHRDAPLDEAIRWIAAQ